jgi:PAS domain S-box-containing protein
MTFIMSLLIIENISQKMTESQTINNENSFQVIFQTSNEGIIVVDSKGVIQLANPTSERMFGYEAGGLKGISIDQLVPTNIRDGHAKMREGYHANPSPRTMGTGRDLKGRKKDGKELPIEVSLSHTVIDGRLQVVAFIIDISKRIKIQEKLKRSEAQLITYATELESRVKRRTEDLDATIKKLEFTNNRLQSEIEEREKAEKAAVKALGRERELNELKSRFVSTASHEFRTPLSSILSSASLIDKYISMDVPVKAQKHIRKIKSSVKNLTDILNDFLSLGKLEEGKVELDVVTVNLYYFIPEVISEIEGILKKGQSIELDLPNETTVIRTDEKLLKNILFNLLSNASKYSPEESIIRVITRLKDKFLHLSIVDQGIGIPADEQHHLFDRFFRAKNATNIQGTGLGLNIVRKYVELLDGEITFESELSKGTAFHIRIPTNN